MALFCGVCPYFCISTAQTGSLWDKSNEHKLESLWYNQTPQNTLTQIFAKNWTHPEQIKCRLRKYFGTLARFGNFTSSWEPVSFGQFTNAPYCAACTIPARYCAGIPFLDRNLSIFIGFGVAHKLHDISKTLGRAVKKKDNPH